MGKVAGRLGNWSQRFLGCLMAVALTCTFAFPMMPGAAVADPLPDGSQEARIQELLQGDYVEGRVLVSVSDNVATSPRSRSLSEGAALLSSAQDLMTVTPQEETPAPAPANGIAPLSLESDTPSETIKLIESDTLTTEELIRALINEPGVTAIEPDYLQPIEDTPSTPLTLEEYTELVNSAATTKSAANTSIGQPDFTSLQWSNKPDGEVGMHVPGWDNDPVKNMKEDVYVAVIDNGVDYNHPDLAGAFEPLPHVTAAGVTGGDFGIDTWSRDNDPMPIHDHGTHCAGIIASTWNNGGTSGVGSRVKLVAVRAGGDIGLSQSAAIMGYAYLKELINAKIPVRVASNSWGSMERNNLLMKVVDELGRCGMVTVFAAGNNGIDLQESKIASAYVAGPHTIVVGSSNEQGRPDVWSAYSTRFVDVYAPGSNIFSTMPTALGGYANSQDAPVYREDFEEFTPGSDDLLEFWDVWTHKKPLENVSVSQEVFYSDGSQPTGHSIALSTDDLTLYDNTGCVQYCFLSLPREKVKDAAAVSMRVAYVGAGSELYAQANVGSRSSGPLGLRGVDPDHAHEAPWTEVVVMIPEVDAETLPVDTEYINIFLVIESTDGTQLDGTLYVDDLVLSSGDSVVPYGYGLGTSMAAPAIAGATAVLMSRDGYNGGSPEEAALAAATISGSVVQDPVYEDRCVSSGTFDFNCLDNPVPVVRTLNLQGDQLNIGGYFFGNEKGKVTFTLEDGAPMDVSDYITSWNDRAIVVSGAEVPPGQVTVTVTAPRPSGDANAYGRQTKLLIDDTQLYETDFTSLLPDDPEFKWSMVETLTALGGTLYRFSIGEYEGQEHTGTCLWAFDLQTRSWSKVPLPQTLAGKSRDIAQTVAYQGKLLVYTSEFEQEGVNELHSYDPVTGEWRAYVLPESIPLAAGIGVLGDELLFAGGLSFDDAGLQVALDSLVAYDLETGEASPRGQLSEARAFAIVRSNGSSMVVALGSQFDEKGNQVPLESFEGFEANDASLESSLAARQGRASRGSTTPNLTPLDFALVKEGVAGVFSMPNERFDTYIMPFDVSLPVREHPVKVSSVPLSYAACEAYEGNFYVLGFNDPTAPDSVRVFRATAMETIHNPHTDLREPVKDPTGDPTNDPTSTVDLPTTKPNPKPPVATGDSPALPIVAVLSLAGLVGVAIAGRRSKKEREYE